MRVTVIVIDLPLAFDLSLSACSTVAPLYSSFTDNLEDRVRVVSSITPICRSPLNFDLNSDGRVDNGDMDELVQNILGTNYGDSNLDGTFNSKDLIKIFQIGEYEDGVDGNSTWADGDWNCDGDFDSSDLIVAFVAGAYSADAVPLQGIVAAAVNPQDQAIHDLTDEVENVIAPARTNDHDADLMLLANDSIFEDVANDRELLDEEFDQDEIH